MSADGRVIAGRYRLREPLGSGGMADVHIARDEVLDREVAVKVLPARYLGDETFLERFRREARSASRLSHPNIVAVHDTGTDDGVPYIVMELVPGRSLDHVLAERGRMEVRPAVAVLGEVCEALAHAHANGVVHRDVKPGNILLIADGDAPEVKVADFGIARAAGDDTITLTSVLGTAAYLSPEQAQGERADHRADLYSAGIVLYELLTGAPPYADGTAVQVALRHVGGRPDPPSEHVEGVSADLDAVVLTALAKEPDDRYQTAEAFRRDLRAVLAGEPVSVDRDAALTAAAGLAGSPDTLRGGD